jgi:pimeloyl-ACP methyl ester carboxylesterase
MESVVSADGTDIGYETRGSGQPLVCVHGTAGSRESWRTLPARFAEDYQVVAMDRRGRGASGDGDEYSLQREIEDVYAVLDAVGGDSVLFGHSYGALVALEAADRGADISALVLYEPALVIGEPRPTHGAEMRSRLESGDAEGSVELFFRTLGGDALVDEMPIPAVAEIAETVVREFEVVTAYRLDTLNVDVPTLLLIGDASPNHLQTAAETAADRLREGASTAATQVATMEGVGHQGIKTAPEQVEAAVRPFLD